MATVSFVIVTHCRRACLERAVASVRAHGPPGAEIVVVDNASGDDTWAWIEAQEGLVGIRCPENRGPGPGRNVGVKAARGDLVFFLDDDAYLVEPVVDAGLQALATAESVGGVAFPIWEVALGRVVYGGRSGPAKVFAAGGALFRKEALLRSGLFDEKIRWSEEFDLSVRLHATGFTLRGLERPFIHHQAATPGTAHSGAKLRSVAAGRLRSVFTRFSWPRAALMASRVLVGVGVAGLRGRTVSPVPLAVADTIRDLPDILARRSVVPRSVEDLFFQPNEFEDENSIPVWRKLLSRGLHVR